MTINISETQRVTVWDVEHKEKHSIVRMSSSRKDKETQEYRNSNWSFVRFVGKAHEKAISENLKREDRIVLKGAIISLEEYYENGEKKYPKFPRITVFNWELQPPFDGATNVGMDKPPVVATSQDDDEMPF